MMRKTTAFLCVCLMAAGAAFGQMPAVGTMAPAFTTRDHLGKTVTFPVKGEWNVLAFYPRASSPG